MRHDKRPTKWCKTCETHFRALPQRHESEYHPDGDWEWFNGTWRDAKRRDRFKYK